MGVLCSADDETVLKPDLRPVLSLKSRIVLIWEVAAGECMGYGRSFTAGRDSLIAILAGAEGYGKLSVPAVAGSSGSISNELLCRLGARLPVIAI